MTPTARYVVDSWAWLELFAGSKPGRRVDELVSGGEAYTSAISLAEVVSVSARRGRPTSDKVAVIRSLSKVVSPTSEDATDAGRLHADVKKLSVNFSMSDAFALQLARKLTARVLTGDPDFQGIKDALMVG